MDGGYPASGGAGRDSNKIIKRHKKHLFEYKPNKLK